MLGKGINRAKITKVITISKRNKLTLNKHRKLIGFLINSVTNDKLYLKTNMFTL